MQIAGIHLILLDIQGRGGERDEGGAARDIAQAQLHLGLLGFFTSIIAIGNAADSLGLKALVAIPAAMVFLLPVFRPDLKARLHGLGALVGCIFPAIMIWTTLLPRTFAFGALDWIGAKVLLASMGQSRLVVSAIPR